MGMRMVPITVLSVNMIHIEIGLDTFTPPEAASAKQFRLRDQPNCGDRRTDYANILRYPQQGCTFVNEVGFSIPGSYLLNDL